jgi:hypothetical protein
MAGDKASGLPNREKLRQASELADFATFLFRPELDMLPAVPNASARYDSAPCRIWHGIRHETAAVIVLWLDLTNMSGYVAAIDNSDGRRGAVPTLATRVHLLGRVSR